MASPSHAPAGSTTSWKSPTVHVNEQYSRLRTLAYHAGFTKSPFFPKDAMAYSTHNLAFKTDNADQLRLRIRETMEMQKRKMDRAWCYEVPDEVVALYGPDHPAVMARMGTRKGAKGKKKGKVSNEGLVEIVACMERLEKVASGQGEPIGEDEFKSLLDRSKEVLREFQERIYIEEIRNRNTEKGLSKVLGLPTAHWKGNEAALTEGKHDDITEQSRAYWPTIPELKAEGDDRVKIKGLKRRLPLPTLDMLSKDRVAEMFWQRFDMNDDNARSEERMIFDMIEMADHTIEPKHREIVEYKGPIDELECITRKYEEFRTEMLKEKEQTAEQMKALMASSPAITHSEMSMPVMYGSEYGGFGQESPNTHYVHVPGTQYMDASGNVHQATFSSPKPIHTVVDASGNFDRALRAPQCSGGGEIAQSHGHGKKHSRDDIPRESHTKENRNFLGYGSPENQYNHTGAHGDGHSHRYGYNGESSGRQGDNEQYAAEQRFGGADVFNSKAPGVDESSSHEELSDATIDEMMDEKTLREQVGWAGLLDALEA